MPYDRKYGTGEPKPLGPEPSWEQVLERNSIERLKQEKPPVNILDELEELGAKHYLDIPEEDLVRLKWYGLYHDKPKVGTFMLRIKVPAGLLPPASLRAIAEVSLRYGQGYSELSTRQNVQVQAASPIRLRRSSDAARAVGFRHHRASGQSRDVGAGRPVARKAGFAGTVRRHRRGLFEPGGVPGQAPAIRRSRGDVDRRRGPRPGRRGRGGGDSRVGQATDLHLHLAGVVPRAGGAPRLRACVAARGHRGLRRHETKPARDGAETRAGVTG